MEFSLDKSEDILPSIEEDANFIDNRNEIKKVQRGRWSEQEHKRFMEAIEIYGIQWKDIYRYVGTRTSTQVRSHAQKCLPKWSDSKVRRKEKPINKNKDISLFSDSSRIFKIIRYGFHKVVCPLNKETELLKQDKTNSSTPEIKFNKLTETEFLIKQENLEKNSNEIPLLSNMTTDENWMSYEIQDPIYKLSSIFN